jgi:hypothetical protein
MGGSGTFAVMGRSGIFTWIGLDWRVYWGFLVCPVTGPFVLPPLGSIKASACVQFSFLSSFTLSAYQRVLRECSQQDSVGEMLAIITVLHFGPMKESLSTWVSLLPRKGVCFLSWSRALMHSFRASRDLLISAPSIQVYFPFSCTSAPLSLPARSMKESFPNCFPFGSLIVMVNTACDLEESALAPV